MLMSSSLQAIVCSQSSVLEAAIDNAWQESQSSTIVHEEFDAATVECFLSYLYLADYSIEPAAQDGPRTDESEAAETGDTPDLSATKLSAVVVADVGCQSAAGRLIQHALVYGIADFYDVSGLKDMATARFNALLDQEKVVDGMIHVIETVCTHTNQSDRTLRAPLVDLVANHLRELRQHQSFQDGMAESSIAQSFLKDVLYKLDDIHATLTDLQEATLVSHKTADDNMQLSLARQTARADHAERMREGAEAELASLLEHIRGLDRQCRNAQCTAEPGSLRIEQKGNGAWRIRCGRCRCKLVN